MCIWVQYRGSMLRRYPYTHYYSNKAIKNAPSTLAGSNTDNYLRQKPLKIVEISDKS